MVMLLVISLLFISSASAAYESYIDVPNGFSGNQVCESQGGKCNSIVCSIFNVYWGSQWCRNRDCTSVNTNSNGWIKADCFCSNAQPYCDGPIVKKRDSSCREITITNCADEDRICGGSGSNCGRCIDAFHDEGGVCIPSEQGCQATCNNGVGATGTRTWVNGKWNACSATTCVSCNTGYSLANGKCTQTILSGVCTEECSNGQKVCSGSNGLKTCGQYDTDTCLEWGTSFCSYGCDPVKSACKPKPVNGVCGNDLDSCISGTFQDVSDTSTDSKWNCLGINGGNAACSKTKSPECKTSGDCTNNNNEVWTCGGKTYWCTHESKVCKNGDKWSSNLGRCENAESQCGNCNRNPFDGEFWSSTNINNCVKKSSKQACCDQKFGEITVKRWCDVIPISK